MKPISLEVFAPTFEGIGICTSCELVLGEAGVGQNPAERALDEYPQEWQDEYRRLTDWVYDLAGRYGDRIRIKVVDPQSLEGMVKSVRYWVRRYPTFVIERRDRVVGWERESLEAALEKALSKVQG